MKQDEIRKLLLQNWKNMQQYVKIFAIQRSSGNVISKNSGTLAFSFDSSL